MRYYYEPKEPAQKRKTKKDIHEQQNRNRRYDSLVIEEDTVYEIDETCKRQMEFKR